MKVVQCIDESNRSTNSMRCHSIYYTSVPVRKFICIHPPPSLCTYRHPKVPVPTQQTLVLLPFTYYHGVHGNEEENLPDGT